jgi:hypothetical protein
VLFEPIVCVIWRVVVWEACVIVCMCGLVGRGRDLGAHEVVHFVEGAVPASDEGRGYSGVVVL